MKIPISSALPKLVVFSALLLAGATQNVRAQNENALQNAPKLQFEARLVQGTLGKAYESALDNLLRLNTVFDKEDKYNPTGLMAQSKDLFIRAGGAYDTPWTRDASINSWNAASLLEPTVARNTLWAVCQKENGNIVLQRDNQWWDKVIWIEAAWNHFKVTGDEKFLATAYGVAQDELALMRREHFSATYGLFQGPAFFADGIAGYPEPEYDPTNGSSFVLDHRYTKEMMALSTNCVYYGAYRSAALMATQLKRAANEAKIFNATADELKSAIQRRLWNSQKGTYGYFIHGAGPLIGKRDETQESIGLAYAILLGVADKNQAQSVVKTAHVTDYGIPTQWPHFARFSDEKPGRHNVSLWPLVGGMWACAAAQTGDINAFRDETEKLALLALNSSNGFYEIYNFRSGKPDGGWQTGRNWGPLADQTWSASAYLRTIYGGLFGMDFQPSGVRFAPHLPADWKNVRLTGVKYRALTLDISLQGQGGRVAQSVFDGKIVPTAFVPANLLGHHSLVLTMKK